MDKKSKKKKTILVVEDEETLSQAITKKLKLNGFNVIAARSIKKAMDHSDNCNSVHAVWLDHYLLGKETGLDFVIRMKENKKCKQVPIFVVSNTASPDKRHAYLQLGANKFYVKSDYKIRDIVSDIKNFLEEKNK